MSPRDAAAGAAQQTSVEPPAGRRVLCRAGALLPMLPVVLGVHSVAGAMREWERLQEAHRKQRMPAP